MARVVMSRKMSGVEGKCADVTHLPQQSRVRQQVTCNTLPANIAARK